MHGKELITDFGRLARILAKHSPCKRRGVACVVLDRAYQVVGWGVNEPARGGGSCTGEKDRCGCSHSEVNTILNCQPRGRDHIMIVSRAPCVPCATAMVNCGFITTAYIMDPSEPGADGVKVLKNCGIEVSWLDVPEDAEIELRDPTMAPSRPSDAFANKGFS